MKTFTRSELSKTMKKRIKEKEQSLNRKCRTIWDDVNLKGERILYASFCRDYDRLIVSLGYWKNHMLLTIS